MRFRREVFLFLIGPAQLWQWLCAKVCGIEIKSGFEE